MSFKADFYPIGSEARREVANLTERKNLHIPVCGLKEFVCLSVCMYVTKYFFTLFTKNGEIGLVRHCFKTEVKFLTQKYYPDLQYSQGVRNLPHKFHCYYFFIFSLQSRLSFVEH